MNTSDQFASDRHGSTPIQIVVLGGGYVGMYAAIRLQRGLRRANATITVIDPRSYMTYQSFLAEVAAGSLEPRHVVVPLRSILDRCRIITGSATWIDTRRKSVTVEIPDGHSESIGYDVLVVAPGSVTKTLPVPGLAEEGIGFKTLEEALYLRNHVLSRLDVASSTLDPGLRKRLLTFMFVGGGYAGVEALAELQDMAGFAARRHHEDIDERELRWVLVEAANRIMPEVSPSLAEYTVQQLRQEGIEVRLHTQVKSLEGGQVVLDDGTEFAADTIVWTAGVRPHPLIGVSDLPRDEAGRIRCAPTLRVEGMADVFAAGDCAAIPDLTQDDPDATCPPTAQHAVRQGKQLGDNMVDVLRGEQPRQYRHRAVGSVATLGVHRGVAEIYGHKIKGLPAWGLHRLYHLASMPTAHRRARILADWLLELPFPRQVVALGETHQPRAEFTQVSVGGNRH